jgi:hypothetical protein
MSTIKQPLTPQKLFLSTKKFCLEASRMNFSNLFGITDGKAIGTFVEHLLIKFLSKYYIFDLGNSAFGIDLPAPEINTDIKFTSSRQPQSSCPYKSSRQ